MASCSSKYPCLICGQEGLDESEMRSHMLAVHELSDISCPMCHFSNVTAHEMELHINRVHLDITSPTKPNVKNNDTDTKRKKETNSASSPRDMDNFQTNYNLNLEENELIYRKLNLNSKNTIQTKMDTTSTVNCPMCSDFKTDSLEVLELHLEHSHSGTEKELKNSVQTKGKSQTSKINTGALNIEAVRQGIPSRQNDKRTLDNKTDNQNANISETIVRRESQTDMLDCPYCDLILPKGVSLKSHLNGHHPEVLECSKDDTEEAPVYICPLCQEPAANQDSLQRHVDLHFASESSPPKSLKSNAGSSLEAQERERRARQAAAFYEKKQPPPAKHKSQPQNYTKGNKNAEKVAGKNQMSILDFCAKENRDVSGSNNKQADHGSTSSSGLIERLHGYYQKPNKFTANYWLASPTDHFCGATFDRGWGCGYRNFQMLLSCLIHEPNYNRVVFNGQSDIPSVSKIQLLIEEAWARGFDPQGREQLDGRISNTRKWIGATEIYAVLSSLKVRCQLVDFYRPTGPEGTHPRMFQWVRDYFSNGGFKPPLYLQHQGHSRSIVGVEESTDGTLKLLLYDPGTPRSQMQQFLRKDVTAQLMRTIRRLPSGMKARQYQILAVRGLLSDYEQKNYKLVRSDRVP